MASCQCSAPGRREGQARSRAAPGSARKISTGDCVRDASAARRRQPRARQPGQARAAARARARRLGPGLRPPAPAGAGARPHPVAGPHASGRPVPPGGHRALEAEPTRVRRTCGVLLAARPLSARRPQDAQAAGAADAPPPAAPEGFWAAEAALLAGARAELTRLGLARGLAASLPASALATAVRGGACITFVHWLHCGPDVNLHAAAAPCGQRPTPSHVRGTQCRPACKRNLQKWKCAAPQAVCASGTGMRRALGRLGCHTCETCMAARLSRGVRQSGPPKRAPSQQSSPRRAWPPPRAPAPPDARGGLPEQVRPGRRGPLLCGDTSSQTALHSAQSPVCSNGNDALWLSPPLARRRQVPL